MKEYSVEKVVKLEEKAKKFDNPNIREENETALFPAMLCFGVGATVFATAIGEPSLASSNLPLILSSAVATLGAAKTVKILGSMDKSDRIHRKLESIYETMGPEFRQSVQEELESRNVAR